MVRELLADDFGSAAISAVDVAAAPMAVAWIKVRRVWSVVGFIMWQGYGFVISSSIYISGGQATLITKY